MIIHAFYPQQNGSLFERDPDPVGWKSHDGRGIRVKLDRMDLVGL